MTLTEFLAGEEVQEPRFEFDGFQPVAMTGGTIAHDQIIFDPRTALAVRLFGKPCGPVSPAATVASNPVIVFEVLSDGGTQTDLIDKNREYRATPSIQRYVVPQQTHKAAIAFARRENLWPSEIVSGDDASLDLPEIEVAVPLREVYANAGLLDAPQEGSVI